MPVCAACSQRHRSEFKPVPLWTRLRPVVLSAPGLSLLGPLLMFLFFLSKTDSWVMLIPVTIFGTIAAGLAWRLWAESKRYGVPADTSVSADFKFSQGKRWRFEIFNDDFGDAFIQANRDRVYNRYSPDEIDRRNRKALLQWALFIAVVLFGLWNMVAEWFCCS